MNTRLLGLSLSLLWMASASQAQEWTRFRGPNGTGESEATTIPVEWTEKDYNWRVKLPGYGHSSPVLWGDKIFLTSAEDEGVKRLVLCVNAEDGKLLWTKEYASTTHGKHKFNNFASSTPAVDKDQVYVSWATPEAYTVLALDHDGQETWKVDLGPFESQHGYGTSPIVFEDMVIVNNDQDRESFLVALDRRDGSQCWKTPRETAVAAYSTPCVYQPPGRPVEMIFNSQAHGITSIDPKTGRKNWEISVFDKRSVSSPLVVAGLVFGSCGSGQGGNYVVAVRPGAKPEVAYKVDRAAPYVPTSVAKGDLLFLWSDNGLASCIMASTGEAVWSQQRVGGNFFGSPVRVGDHIYCVSTEGEVVVLHAGPEFKVLARNQLDEPCYSTPAVAGGRMYIRTESHLVSIGGK